MARSAEGQAFQRALKASPEDLEIYRDLTTTKSKEGFREAWAKQRSFEFMQRERESIHSRTQSAGECGVYLPKKKILKKLGGPDAKSECDTYCANCEKYPEEMCKTNALTGQVWYLWVEEFRSNASKIELKDILRLKMEEAAPDSWTAKVERSRALRAFAECNNKRLDLVTDKDVAESELGVKGWAAKFMDNKNKSAPASTKKSQGQPKAKAKGKAKAKCAPLPQEKVAKDLCGQLQSTQTKVERVVVWVKDDPTNFAWCEVFLQNYRGFCESLTNAQKNNSFISEYCAALHVPAEMKSLKKARLNQFCCCMH
jgi:hypothetical protein